MHKSMMIAASLAVLGFATSASANPPTSPELEITDIAVNGSGCPAGSVDAVVLDDLSQAVILFSKYRAKTGPAEYVATADCNIAIAMKVPPGYAVGVIGMDWRGTVVALPNSLVTFHREYFFSGARGASFDDHWLSPSPIVDNFTLEDDPLFITYGGCGGDDLIARADTSASVLGPNALFSLRAADIDARLIVYFDVVPCYP